MNQVPVPAELALPDPPDPVSGLLRRLMDVAARNGGVTVGDILHMFGVRGFAFLLFVLALLNIVIFMVPFLSFFLGLPMVILTAQMVIGLEAPVFPAAIRNRKIAAAPLTDGIMRAIRWIELLERYIKPRLMFLSSPALIRVHALFALALAIMVTLPIPVVNVPPSIGIFILAIGLLQRDGALIALAYAVGWWCFLLFKSLDHVAHLVTAW